ncbi:MAG: T9SS type A sorting domain-containing protein [Bacteroidetes bacterium]|nr:T9SS type A sorting domain-containing protein [Bacteroidota bacterium]
MKKFFLVLIINCTNASLHAQTSVYHPFPDSSASWNYSYSNVCWGIIGNSSIDYYNSYFIGQDTLINNVSYHSFQVPAFVYQAGPNCTPPGFYILPGKYAGAFRNDHPNKKVYIVPEADSIEQLLFDFNMQVGDSLKGFLSICVPNAVCDTVIAIDSVLVGNAYRKRWHINSDYHVYFIEGIGSTYGLLRYVPTNWTDHDDINLDCFSQNGQNLYPDTLGSCPLLTSVATLPSSEIIIKIHPNPSNGNINVDLGSTKISESWTLFSLNGQVIQSEKIHGKNQFEIKGISPGFYLLTISFEDGRKVNRKIIVQ